MKTKLWIASLTFACICSCSKDLYTTAPQLVFQSVNATRFATGDPLSFTLQATDKEGDIQDSIFLVKVSYDTTMCENDTLAYMMPSFSPVKDIKANIFVNYVYNSLNGPYPIFQACSSIINQSETKDSCYFRFWIHDNAGHTSDTVRSPDVVLLAQ